jgi:hypothetical protein
LKEHFAQVDAPSETLLPEQAEDIINEAMRSVRPGYRPYQ